MGPKLIKSNVKLTIGILVSNRIDTIRKCMESIRPLLAAIPSELIAVDTVGEKTDGSIDIVREYTDKIYRFVWCNDFAAARNVCIDHAKGEWFLFLDDDEWFDDVQELIDFFRNGESERYYSGYYYVKNYESDGGSSMSIVGRMIRRTVNTRFIGKVHESFNEVFSPNKQFSCFVHHNGYVFADEASKKKHQERNLSILREEMRAKGRTPKICAQIVQELLFVPETRKEGGKFCEESIEYLAAEGKLGGSCAQWLLLASVRFYFSEDGYEQAIRQAEEICSSYQVTQMAQVGIAWVTVCSAAFCKDYPAIEKWVPIYIQCYDWLKAHPEEALTQTNLDMPKYYSEERLADVLQAGIVVANQMGKFEEALEYFKRFPWKEYEAGQTEWFDGSRYQKDLLTTLRGLKDKSYLVSYYQKLYKEEWFLPENRGYLPKECREAMDGHAAPLLSISLLVSNRKDTIGKCMESLKPLMAAVPSELIAVDTVGEEKSDGSLAIVKEYTDNIVHFDWCDDFAAARNAGLKEAKGEWFLFIDDDEWFENVTPIILFFLEGDYKQYDGACYKVRNYTNWEGTEYIDTFAGRMCRISPKTHFEGRIHELLIPQPTNIMQFFCYVHHYGYVYHNEEERKRHQERNTALIERELEQAPDNLRMMAQLMQEYDADGRYEEAEALCRKSLEKYSASTDPYVQYFSSILFRVIAKQPDHDAAASKLAALDGAYPLCKSARLVYLTMCSSVAVQCRDYSKVLQIVPEWMRLKEEIKASDDEAMIQVVFDFNNFLSPEYEKDIVREGIYALLETEEYKIAQTLLERVPWSDEKDRPFGEMVCLTKLYGKSGKPELFFPYAEKIIANPEMKEEFFVSLQDLVRDYPERKEEVSVWLRKQEAKKPKPKQAVSAEMAKLAGQLKENIRELIAAGNKEEAKELLMGLKELMPGDEEVKMLEQRLE